MRYVDRTPFHKPDFLDEDPWQRLCDQLEKTHHRDSGGKRGTQTITDFDGMFSEFRERAIEALLPVFAGKCAYTEQPGHTEMPLLFHLHRPGADALGLDGSPSPEHYWWLQTQWTNWMLVSPQIMSIKGTNFPVVGPRLEHEGTHEEVPLLVDPCSEQPAWWLEFRDDGVAATRRVESAVLNDRYPGFNRGEFNIRALDLNESSLTDGRRREIAEISEFKYVLQSDVANLQGWLERNLSVDRPFLGTLRQHVARVLIAELEALSVSMWTEQILLTVSQFTHEIAADLAARPERVSELRQRMTQPRFEYLLDAVIRTVLDTCPDLSPLFREPEAAPPIDEPESADTRSGPDAEPEPDDGDAPPRQQPQAPPPPEPAIVLDTTIERQARLREIRIRNFRAIEDLTIVVPDGVETVRVGPLHDRRERTSAVNWKMFLGENACGKSSILQAIALALFGPEIKDDPPAPLARLRRRGIGNKQSFVELTFRGHDRPVRLRLNRRGFKYAWEPDFKLFVRAYGATRLLPSDAGRNDASGPTTRRRVGNLFDPLFPVVDVNEWLLSLDEGDFNVAARAIRNLIGGFGGQDEAARVQADLVRDPEAGTVTLSGDALDELSDGYRTLLALTCDIMAGLGSGLSDMENAVGIVLIDEIGAHLHPRLRMQVVSRLRYIFPQIQFLCSTHEPLCLRGLFDREVDRIARIDGKVSKETIDRDPSSYRIDQLLTSEFFGLDTTIDPEIDSEFRLYYHLLAKDNLTATEQQQRDRLRNRLITEGVLGYTRRDQMVYEAIDSYLADRRTMSSAADRKRDEKLKQATIERVKQIWSLAELKRTQP